MKRLPRLVKIFRVAHRFGLSSLVLEHAPTSHMPWPVRLWRWLALRRQFSQSRGERLRLALQALGPIFVKFGQVLSTRRDLMPPDLADELALLQDQVPPFDSTMAIAQIELALGQPIAEIFDDFEATPVASASIAQVHFATLRAGPHAGKKVAVKVLRPGMKDVIDDDLALLHFVAGLVESLSADGRRLRPKEVVAEFDHYLHDELDLVREAANASQLRRNFERSKLLRVPEMYWDYCRANVLVMERMVGIPISHTEQLLAAQVDLEKLARDGVEIFFTQVFRDGFFHADMHPGNIFVGAEGADHGRYIALDFGIVGTLSDFDKNYLAHNFLAFFRRDYHRVAELHVESGWVPADTRIEALEAAVRTVCEPYFDRPLKEISLGQVLLRLFQTSRRFNVEIQPQLVLLQKTLLNIEGLGRQLDPELDLWKTAKPFLERWMMDQIGLPSLERKLLREAENWSKILPELPRLIHQQLVNAPRHDETLQQLVLKLQAQQSRQQQLTRWLILAVIVALGLQFIYEFKPFTL